MNAARFKVIEEPYREMQEFLATSHIGRTADDGVDGLIEHIKAEGDGRIRPIRLPWREVDRALGYGLTPGQVTIIAGSAGVSKSYLLLNILRHANDNKIRWRLLPLEDSAHQWVTRMMAVHICSWLMVKQPEYEEERRRVADDKLAVLEAHRDYVKGLYQNIFENPRLPIDDGAGRKVVRDVHYSAVLSFLGTIAEDCDIIGLDCLSQVDFSEDGRDYVGQADFMRKVVGIAAASGAHVILVGHNGKGGANRDPLDSVQGSALFNRLAHNVISLVRHDPLSESEIFSFANPMVEHRLTLGILKCRGGMSGDRIAMDLDANGPLFKEYGKIKSPKAKR